MVKKTERNTNAGGGMEKERIIDLSQNSASVLLFLFLTRCNFHQAAFQKTPNLIFATSIF